MSQLRKPYDRAEVLARLDGVKGLRRVMTGVQGNQILSHFTASSDVHIGIRLWGYIDFLGVPVVRTN